MPKGPKVWSGEYYGVRPDGWLERVRGPVTATHIGCRRVADCYGGELPAGAAAAPCTQCGVLVAYNLARHHTAPYVCLQCLGIIPDPAPPPLWRMQ
jgi:hypothetical protein